MLETNGDTLIVNVRFLKFSLLFKQLRVWIRFIISSNQSLRKAIREHKSHKLTQPLIAWHKNTEIILGKTLLTSQENTLEDGNRAKVINVPSTHFCNLQNFGYQTTKK